MQIINNKPSLFHPEYFTQTKKANEIYKEVEKKVENILKKYIRDGYNPIEVENLIIKSTIESISFFMLRRAMYIKKEKKEIPHESSV